MSVREVEASAIPDADRFEQMVSAGCEPVVLRGICRHWPAVAAARSPDALRSYLLGFSTAHKAEAFVGSTAIAGRYYYGDDLEGFNFERVEMSLAEALAGIWARSRGEAEGTMYMGSLQADRYLPGFAAENRLDVLPQSVGPRLWVGNASQVSCHYDTFDNLACVVAGRRRFTLFRPEAISDLYVGPIDHTMAGPPVGLAVGAAPGDPRYPRFEAIRDQALIIDLEPGDGLYLPKLWWHQVEGLDPINVLVNYWWDQYAQGPDAPMTALLLAMITIAERPEKERAAWRAFFDHYVFRGEGHPLAHLPPEKHGILGALAKGNYGRIRAMVMQRLRNF